LKNLIKNIPTIYRILVLIVLVITLDSCKAFFAPKKNNSFNKKLKSTEEFTENGEKKKDVDTSIQENTIDDGPLKEVQDDANPVFEPSEESIVSSDKDDLDKNSSLSREIDKTLDLESGMEESSISTEDDSIDSNDDNLANHTLDDNSSIQEETSEVTLNKEKKENEVIKDIIEYEADSMSFDIKKSKISMLGNSNVRYGKDKLEAHKVSINWVKNILSASSKEGEDKKVALEDKILFFVRDKEFFSEKFKLNFESQRATVNDVFTKIEEGILRAHILKKDYDDVLYIDRMSFTTCNLLRPHFGICADRAKVTQDERIVSGPVYFTFSDVPIKLWDSVTPIFFGMFVAPDKKQGIIPPRYGGSTDKGIHIKEFGYYWNFDDRVDLSITADMHTGGTLGVNSESFYKKRYIYNGNLAYKRSKNITNDAADKKWQFVWNHATENNRVSSFFVDLDIQNDSFRKETKKTGNSQNATLQSNIRYTNKLVDIPFYSLGVKLNYSKNFSKEESTLVLPNIILYTNNIYPFRGSGVGGLWYKDINLRHSIEFKNKITAKNDYLNFLSPDDWPLLYSKKKYGVNNTVPLKTNIKLGYFNLIPFAEGRVIWYWEHMDHFVDPKTIHGFKQVWDYELGSELTTTFYGTFLFTKNREVAAMRHQVKPSLKLVYTPTFEKQYWQSVDGKLKSKFEDYVYDTPSNTEKLVLHTSLGNVLEMKLKTVDQEGNSDTKKIPILEGFDVKSSYDFLAKEFPMGDIEFKARTRLFDGSINIQASRTYDPYSFEEQTDQNYKRIQKLAISNKQGIGHLKNAKLTISTEFTSQKESKDPIAQMIEAARRKAEFENPEQTAQTYVSFSIPWVIGIKYDYNYSSTTPEDKGKIISKIVSAETRLNLSEKWVLGLQSGYDFKEEEVVKNITKITVYRDLHCWQLEFTWLPIAPMQYFQFSIGVKAPVLQAIKYTRGEKPYIYV
jgi:hypothetical protein